MGLTNNLGRISTGLTADASLNLGVGVTPSGTYKFEVGTTSKFTGVATFGSTLSNGTYTYTLPSATGTLALTSAIPTNAVGASGFWTSGFLAKINGTYTVTSSIIQDDGGSHVAIGYLTNPALYMLDVNGTGKFVGQLTLGSTITNGTYTYTLPSATGTLALTSALSGYLPLTGGTLTGALGGTSANFSSSVTAVGIQMNGTGGYGILARADGHNTAANGAYIGFVNNAFNRYFLSQLDTNNDINYYYFNGSSWSSSLMKFSNTGAATFSSSVTAGGTNYLINTSTGTNVVYQRILNTGGDLILGLNNSAGNALASGGLPYATSIYNNTATAIQFGTSGVFNMTIANGGNVGIGTTTDAGYKLDVNGTGRFSGSVAMGRSISSVVRLIVSGQSNTSSDYAFIAQDASTNNLFYIRNDGATIIANLAGTGSRAVLADASGFLSAPVSDSSVKENIKRLDYGIADIMKLKPISFEYIKSYKNYGEGKQIGNIAQDMQKVIPEAVFTTPSTGKMGINYDQLNGVYIKALQELQEQINILKSEIQTLKNK